MRILFAALLAASFSASAASFDNGEVAIAFEDSACDKASLRAFLATEGDPKKASALVGGKVVHACYVVDRDGDYLIVDENGNGGYIPKDQVKGKGA